MSFGFGVGDFLAVLKLADSVRQKWADAPAEYAAIREKIKSVGNLLRDIDDVSQLDDVSAHSHDRLSHGLASAQQALQLCEKLADKCIVGKAPVPGQRRLRRAWDRITSDPAEVRNARQLLDSCVTELATSLNVAQSFSLSALHTAVDGLQSSDDQRLKNQVAIWLSAVDHGSYQDDHLSRRTARTGHWFLQDQMYQHWRESPNSQLLCPGIPGAGKTIMTATIISDLTDFLAHDKQAAVTYYYCNFARRDLQTPSNVLAGLARQLLQSLQQLPQYVRQLYEKHQPRGTFPTEPELQDLLSHLLREYRRVFILVDALDEFGPSLPQLLKIMLSFQSTQAADTALLYTSRPITDILDRIQCPLLEIRAHHGDIELYLGQRLSELMVDTEDGLDDESGTMTVAEAVISRITGAADGMFLLAKLQFDSLLDKISIDDLQDALSRFSANSTALDEQYDNALTRIEQQLEGRRLLAHKVLAWVTFARRELSVLELREAVAIKEGMTRLSGTSFPQAKYLTSFCAGLVDVDETAGIVRLVHYTAQEYLQRVCEQRILSEKILASACITRLRIAAEDSHHNNYALHVYQQLQDHPFLEYAAVNFGWHIQSSLPYGPSEQLIKLLQNEQALELFSLILVRRKMKQFRGAKKQSGLHVCTNFDDPELLQLLLANGAELNCEDGRGETCLHYAVRRGHMKVVRWLLGQAAINVNAVNHRCETPLSLAVGLLYLELVELLLAHDDIDVNIVNRKHRSSLWLAAARNSVGILRLLLSHSNTDVNCVDDKGSTSLSEASSHGYDEVVTLLLTSGRIDVNLGRYEGLPPLVLASARGYTKIVSALLAHPDIDVNIISGNKTTALLAAAQAGHLEVVTLLLSSDQIDVHLGWLPPLTVAARQGHTQVVSALLARGDININAVVMGWYGGRTALSEALLLQNMEIVDMLLAQEPINIYARNVHGDTPLSLAARAGDIGLFERLVARAGDFIPEYPCHDAVCEAAWSGNLALMLTMHDRFGSSQADIVGRTPLSYAAEAGRIEVVKFLLCKGNGSTIDDAGRTPLSYAAQGAHVEVVDVLLCKGDASNVDAVGRTPLSYAAEAGNPAVVRMLLDQSDPGLADKSGTTPLAYASQFRQWDIAEMLIDAGADVNAADEEGRTALSFAAEAGNSKLVELLLARGATQTEDSTARTPLDWAQRSSSKDEQKVTALLRAASSEAV